MSSFASRVRDEAQAEDYDAPQFVGKYRGTVVNNIDPLGRSRIMVVVPDVSSVVPIAWAEACMPPGHAYTPMIGSGVWIEFEQGDPDYPIWIGAIAGSALDLPPASKAFATPGLPQSTMASPLLQHSITVSDFPATGVVIKGPGLMTITMSAALGIVLTNGASTIAITPAAITITGNVVVV